MNDINFKLGSVNPCGISDAVFYIPKHYIRRWPTIEDDIEALMQGHYAEYDGDFELQPGCWWSRIYNTQGIGKISWEYQGEVDCKVVVNKGTLSYPKLTNEIRADICGFCVIAAGDAVEECHERTPERIRG